MSETTQKQTDVETVQNFEQTPFILDMDRSTIADFHFGVNVAPTLKGISLLEKQLGDKSSIYHLTGKASRSSSRELDEKDLQVLNNNTGKISYHMQNGNRIEVSIEDWNPHNVSSTFTAEKALQVINSNAGFEDLSLNRIGVMEELGTDIASKLGVEPDTKIYHGMENVTPLGISKANFNPTATLKAVMDVMGVDPNFSDSVGNRSLSILFTDYIYLGNGMNHVQLESNNVLKDVVSKLVGTKSWTFPSQVVSNPSHLKYPIYGIRDEYMTFRHSRE